MADGMKDEVEEGDGLGDGGVADLTVLAKQIDLNEIKAVLKVSRLSLECQGQKADR